MQNNIVNEILKLTSPIPLNNQSKTNLKILCLSKESTSLFESNQNAFFMAALFDRGMNGGRAWEIPLQLEKRIGHLDVEKISNMTKEEMIGYLHSKEYGPTLHRFYNDIAEALVYDCKLLVEKYDGDASNIWSRDPQVDVVVKNLLEFKGIGQKIANMFVRMLITYYGVKLDGLKKLDIPVDRHVARVFLRTGLISSKRGKTQYTIAELREPIVKKARELSPAYPAALDEPALIIGMKWCTEREALYDKEGEPCPLSEVCTKRKRHYKIISS